MGSTAFPSAFRPRCFSLGGNHSSPRSDPAELSKPSPPGSGVHNSVERSPLGSPGADIPARGPGQNRHHLLSEKKAEGTDSLLRARDPAKEACGGPPASSRVGAWGSVYQDPAARRWREGTSEGKGSDGHAQVSTVLRLRESLDLHSLVPGLWTPLERGLLLQPDGGTT